MGGLLAGHLAATAVVAAGVASLWSPPLVMIVLTAGGGLCGWEQGRLLTLRPHRPLLSRRLTRGRDRRRVQVSGLNPKVFLLFLALLPQFTDPDADWPLAVQIAVLGLLHVANCMVVYTGVGTGAQLVLRAHCAAARAVSRFSGAAMIVIGWCPGREAARPDMDFGGVSAMWPEGIRCRVTPVTRQRRTAEGG